MHPDAGSPGIIGAILTVLIGDGVYLEQLGGFLSGAGDYTSGQADLLSVITGEHTVNQEWDGERWVNLDQTHWQPIFPWNPAERPGGPGNDPLADLIAQFAPPA